MSGGGDGVCVGVGLGGCDVVGGGADVGVGLGFGFWLAGDDVLGGGAELGVGLADGSEGPGVGVTEADGVGSLGGALPVGDEVGGGGVGGGSGESWWVGTGVAVPGAAPSALVLSFAPGSAVVGCARLGLGSDSLASARRVGPAP